LEIFAILRYNTYKHKTLMANNQTNKLINIKVIGIGNSGIGCLDRMEALADLDIERYAVGLAGKAMQQANVQNKIILNEDDRLLSEEECGAEKVGALLKNKKDRLQAAFEGADMIFIAGSLGREMVGETMAVIGNMAKQANIPVFATTSKPFFFEGKPKQNTAERYDRTLVENVDSLLSINNDSLLKSEVRAMEALTMADRTLLHTINSLMEIVDSVGEINVDFNDFKSIIENAGRAFIGTGAGKRDALEPALKQATRNDYFTYDISGAKRILYVITAGDFISMEEMEYIGDYISRQADPEARIIFGLVVDKEMEDRIKLTVLASEIPEK